MRFKRENPANRLANQKSGGAPPWSPGEWKLTLAQL